MQKLGDGFHRDRLSCHQDAYACVLSLSRKAGSNLMQIHCAPLHSGRAPVQTGEADNVLYQPHHTPGLPVHFFRECRGILRFGQAILQQLRTAADRLQRGLQLVGHIGCKLPANPLCLFQFCLLLLQRGLLCFELTLLAVQPVKQGHYLLIPFLGEGSVQVQLGQGLYNAPGEPYGKEDGERQRGQKYSADGLGHTQDQGKR